MTTTKSDRWLVCGMVLLASTTPAANQVVEIDPGEDAHTIISAAPSPSTFLFTTGTHRDINDYYVFHPRTGDVFTAQQGAILSGAKLLTGASVCGDDWCYSGQTQEEGNIIGECLPTHPRCNRAEVVWIDEVVQHHVATANEVVPGKWFFDYAADTIRIGTDPTGKTVETTGALFVTYPFTTNDNITITGLRMTKFGSLAQFGVVGSDPGATGWTVTNNEVDRAHGCGVEVKSGWTVTGNNIHRNGQIGLCGGGGSGITISNNEIAYNNTEGFAAGWEAGGMKLSQTTNLLVSSNYAHHNQGPGLWTDIDNIDTVYEFNTATDNCAEQAAAPGIFHEISYAAIIRYNTIINNGHCFSVWGWGAGILIAASPDVEVHRNILSGNADGIVAIQQDRGSGSEGPYEIENLNVHDNVTRVLHEGWSGLLQDIGDNTYFTSRNNTFTNNRYDLPPQDMAAFTWNNTELTFSGWQSAGLDKGGFVITTLRGKSWMRP